MDELLNKVKAEDFVIKEKVTEKKAVLIFTFAIPLIVLVLLWASMLAMGRVKASALKMKICVMNKLNQWQVMVIVNLIVHVKKRPVKILMTTPLCSSHMIARQLACESLQNTLPRL